MIDLENIELITKNEKDVSKRDLRKIMSQVFDTRTIEALKKLINQEHIDKVEEIISTGKEANVFLATKGDKKYAVKIYRIETSSFDKMSRYIEGDVRFNNVKLNKQNLVYEWARKEFKNLSVSHKEGFSAPYPIVSHQNVVIMEFIGGVKAKNTLKDETNLTKAKLDKILNQLIKNLHILVYKVGLVHSDLSEYNMIYFRNKLYIIDMGQAVLKSHPEAKVFYDRDISNVVRYFNKNGYNLTEDKLKEMVKIGERNG